MSKVHVEKLYSSDGASEEDNTSETDENNEDNETESKAGLADAMAKILAKSVPQHKQVILAKGETDRQIQKKRKKKEDEEDKPEDKTSLEKKRLWEEMGRVKPDPLERDKERALQKIAQRGVVQLFNAVRKQQKILTEQLEKAGPTETKKSKVLGKMTKGKFLDLLKGQNVTDKPIKLKKEIKQENLSDEEDNKKWDILREDYMMGANMKDWDKDSDSEQDNNVNNDSDSDSDSG